MKAFLATYHTGLRLLGRACLGRPSEPHRLLEAPAQQTCASQQALPVPTHLHAIQLHPRVGGRRRERDIEIGRQKETEGNQERGWDQGKGKEKGRRREREEKMRKGRRRREREAHIHKVKQRKQVIETFWKFRQ